MARVYFNKAFGIASLSGRIGSLIFYTRNGNTYVRAADKKSADPRSILEALCFQCPSNMLSDDGFKTTKSNSYDIQATPTQTT